MDSLDIVFLKRRNTFFLKKRNIIILNQPNYSVTVGCPEINANIEDIPVLSTNLPCQPNKSVRGNCWIKEFTKQNIIKRVVTNRIDIAPVSFHLRVLEGITIDLTGAGE